MLADDHAVVRTGTRVYLESVDWLDIVGEANTRATALKMVQSLKPDLALLGLRLPALDGIAVTQAIVADHLPTRVVIFSGYSAAALVEQAFETGVYGYVLKTKGFDMVVEALRCAAIGQHFLDPGLAAELMHPNTPRLSGRELEVLQLMSDGEQNGTIAFGLAISIDTVKTHVSKILTKLEAGSRTEAVATGLRRSLIQ